MGIPRFFLWVRNQFGHLVEFDAGNNSTWHPLHIDRGANYFPKMRHWNDGYHLPPYGPGTGGGLCCDCLWLDANGFIHPCCHDTAPLPEPRNDEERIRRVLIEIDVLMKHVQPAKMLYIAIDGVAPRAKLNQQRARRFASEKERLAAPDRMQKYREEMTEIPLTDEEWESAIGKPKWDHNVISPGTEFLKKLCAAIRRFIVERAKVDPLWQRVSVVFSSEAVPGEGEHKIMHYLRALRAAESYDPSMRHLIYGQDADLIMLALASHEANIGVLRNRVNVRGFKVFRHEFKVVNIGALRESLRDRFAPSMPVALDEMQWAAALDDFVLICTLVGNDFVPGVPVIALRERVHEKLFEHYLRQGGGTASFRLFVDGAVNFPCRQRAGKIARIVDRASRRTVVPYAGKAYRQSGRKA
jgi:5'-3' exoribonuclease 2